MLDYLTTEIEGSVEDDYKHELKSLCNSDSETEEKNNEDKVDTNPGEAEREEESKVE